MYAPLYNKRYDIVNRITDVEEDKEEKTEQDSKQESSEEKGVLEFWITTMTTGQSTRGPWIESRPAFLVAGKSFCLYLVTIR
jgi:hypothetical protein